jgi:WD40 repeat protein
MAVLNARAPAVSQGRLMKLSLALALVLLLVVPTAGSAENKRLHLVEQLGVGWKDGSRGWMSFVAFSVDGTRIASDGPATANDVSGALTLWSFPDGHFIQKLPLRPTAISKDWTYAASYHSVVDISTGEALISRPESEFVTYSFSPDSRYVAESAPHKRDQGPQIRILQLPDKKQISAFARHGAFAMTYNPDGTLLASGHWDLVTLWNPLTGERLGVLRGFGRYVVAIAFSQDGNFLAAGTDLGTVQLWDVARREELWSLRVGGLEVSTPSFSPDGSLVAIGVYGTGTAWLIDAASGKLIDHQTVSGLGCGSVAFSPDGRFLITPSTGGLITWPYDRGGTIRVFRIDSR